MLFLFPLISDVFFCKLADGLVLSFRIWYDIFRLAIPDDPDVEAEFGRNPAEIMDFPIIFLRHELATMGFSLSDLSGSMFWDTLNVLGAILRIYP